MTRQGRGECLKLNSRRGQSMKGKLSHGGRDSNHSSQSRESGWPVAVIVSFVEITVPRAQWALNRYLLNECSRWSKNGSYLFKESHEFKRGMPDMSVSVPVFMISGLRAKDDPKTISFHDLTSGYFHITLPMGTQNQCQPAHTILSPRNGFPSHPDLMLCLPKSQTTERDSAPFLYPLCSLTLNETRPALLPLHLESLWVRLLWNE